MRMPKSVVGVCVALVVILVVAWSAEVVLALLEPRRT